VPPGSIGIPSYFAVIDQNLAAKVVLSSSKIFGLRRNSPETLHRSLPPGQKLSILGRKLQIFSPKN
jgi:hypothetical protein